MGAEELTRTSYRDDQDRPRDGTTARAESRRDVEGHLLPLLRVHASSLHGAGVAVGLQVGAAPGGTVVTVGPGVAVDDLGRHVVLAAGGRALLGAELVPVTVAGVDVELTDLSPPPAPGPHDLTVTFAETFDRTAHASSGGTVFELDTTPRLALHPPGAGDAHALVLARVEVAADGTVADLAPGPRSVAGTPTGGLTVSRPVRTEPAPDARTVGEEPVGSLTASADGGLALRSAHVHADGPLSVHGPLTASGPLTADGGLTVSGAFTVSRPDAAPALHIDAASGDIGIGVDAPDKSLDVAGRIRLRQGGAFSAGLWLHQDGPGTDRAFVGMATDDQVGFWGDTGARWGLVMDTSTARVEARGDLEVAGALTVGRSTTVDGALTVKGPLLVPKTGDGSAAFGNRVFDNEADLSPNNLKLVMASEEGFLFPSRTPFQFAVGYSLRTRTLGRLVPFRTTFQRVFTVDESGNAFFAGAKVGYVVDYAVNAVGDDLERGDVVVLAGGPPTAHYGRDDAVPMPEVDLTDRPYDGRVFGVVADVVPAGDVPSPEPRPGPGEGDQPTPPPQVRPDGAPEDQPRTRVRDGQVCRIVTLGSWAYCKVDADVAPVATGDLLTTGPTRGHAQKVTDRGRALGTVLGKAMAPLAEGRGVIPVLVTLQ